MGTIEDEAPSGLKLLYRMMLQEIYWCELHLRDVLENMEERAYKEELKAVFRRHRAETSDQVARLEKIFYLEGMAAQPVFCRGMQGLFDEGWQVIDQTDEGSAHRDAVLIVAAQKVEHYEIASYGSLCILAQTLSAQEASRLLNQTLEEERKADELFSQLALPVRKTEPVPVSDPAVHIMKQAIKGMDAGAGSRSTKVDGGASAPGSADALLVDDNGEPKGRRKSPERKK